VGAIIKPKDFLLETLNAEAQTIYSHGLPDVEIFCGEIVWIGFQSDFFQFQAKVFLDGIKEKFQLSRAEQGRSAAAKIDRLHCLVLKIVFSHLYLLAQCTDQGFNTTKIGSKVEVAVVTGLPAKRNVDIDTSQLNSINLQI
jgi:hypothetical protein